MLIIMIWMGFFNLFLLVTDHRWLLVLFLFFPFLFFIFGYLFKLPLKLLVFFSYFLQFLSFFSFFLLYLYLELPLIFFLSLCFFLNFSDISCKQTSTITPIYFLLSSFYMWIYVYLSLLKTPLESTDIFIIARELSKAKYNLNNSYK